MHSFDQLIEQRRSIRKFKTQALSDEDVMQMVACASMAPSPSNSQPVRFIQIQSKNIKSELQKELNTGYQKFLQGLEGKTKTARLRNRINVYYRYSEFIFSAPVVFAVGVTTEYAGFSKLLNQAGLLENDVREHADLDISVGLALSGFILKGESLGIGSCIVSAPLVFIESIESILGVSDVSIRCLIAAGYPDETPARIERKDLQEIYWKI